LPAFDFDSRVSERRANPVPEMALKVSLAPFGVAEPEPRIDPISFDRDYAMEANLDNCRRCDLCGLCARITHPLAKKAFSHAKTAKGATSAGPKLVRYPRWKSQRGATRFTHLKDSATDFTNFANKHRRR